MLFNSIKLLVGKKPVDISLSSNGTLFCINAGELVLGNNITFRGHSTNNRSLIYVSGSSASLTMQTGAKITGNTALEYGGGVYIGEGNFTMIGGEISGNTVSRHNGGGVYIVLGSFIMSGGEISGNAAPNGSGGGVLIFDFTSFIMYNGEITGNTAAHDGGGVGVGIGGNFIMYNGEITGNTATEHGGGVGVGNSNFIMRGGKISGNTAYTGGGVYVYSGGNFGKSAGGTIFGDTDAAYTLGSNENTATWDNTSGHAVYYYKDSSNRYYCNATLNTGDYINTTSLFNNWTKK